MILTLSLQPTHIPTETLDSDNFAALRRRLNGNVVWLTAEPRATWTQDARNCHWDVILYVTLLANPITSKEDRLSDVSCFA